jgi:hypothetical protein
MVGQGALRECLLDDEISSLLTVGRTATGIVNQSFTNSRLRTARIMGLYPRLRCRDIGLRSKAQEIIEP